MLRVRFLQGWRVGGS
ncbi:hypothetical protein LINPERPRIM_LOCUS38074 [Linum perenne]